MPLTKRNPASLRRQYPLYIQVGLVLALGLSVAAFQLPWAPQADVTFDAATPDVIQLEDIQPTQQIETPPPPPRPPVPVAVPDDALLEDEPLRFDAALEPDGPAPVGPSTSPSEGREADEEAPDEHYFVAVEEMPEPIGGIEAIRHKVRYPEMARKAGVEGMVVVQFVVDDAGTVREATVLKGIGAGCDEEALRVIRQTQFRPGRQRGKAVNVKMSIPIRFRLR
ncbi:MAG: TonB family protein [Bacteroidetes bacterium]|jgi:protein TonB|nr:TonB family protein [Bacteroidota bacterium]